MKYISKLLFLSALLFALGSCKKDENKIFLEEGTAPVLTASTTADMVLENANKDKQALVLNWTNPNYMFTTGASSQDVTYTLQVDTAGSNFSTNPNFQEQSIANELSLNLKVKELNAFLSKMELQAGTPYNVEIRVKAALSNGTVPLYSNIIKIKITPYLDFAVEPPGTSANNYLDGELWVVGDASANGWDNPMKSPYDVTQKFTRIDILHYELTMSFNATGGYKLIQKQGEWSTQYHALDGSSAAALAGDFEKRDSDPQFPTPGAGTYKIELNFQTGKYKLTKQ